MKRRCTRRRGYTLVFFAMFLFGFMALAALVIDVGFARLAQRQMQTAVDAAALEGLRFRDDLELPEQERNDARRRRASDFVARVFDDNLDPDDGDAIGFGAGPVVELTGGVGDPSINAGQLLTIPDSPFYKPTRSDGTPGLELNPGDEIHGDMLAGAYHPDGDHDEHADYSRSDFTPATPGDSGNAFLVRMRRTNDSQGLDANIGVSSSGPAIPYLFGRGALFPAGDPDNEYSPRHHGITVRATAIAQEQRVLSVGMPDGSLNLPGLAPFALELTYWNEPTPALQPLKDGEIGTVGRFFAITRSAEMPVVVGRTLPLAESVDPGVEYRGYVAIYTAIPEGSTTNRVVGFGWATAQISEDGATVEIARDNSTIAARNASAVVCYEMCFARALTGDEVTEVLKRNREIEQPLLAPVSVR